ncbi:MAG: hypothetical protein J0H73_00800, partial [Salana multivorans]|nr:hypothetical protein [Salana multivorans]
MILASDDPTGVGSPAPADPSSPTPSTDGVVEEQAKQAWDWFTGAPLRSIVIVLVGLLLVVVARWVLARIMRRLAAAPLPAVDAAGRVTVTLGEVPGDHARARR